MNPACPAVIAALALGTLSCAETARLPVEAGLPVADDAGNVIWRVSAS